MFLATAAGITCLMRSAFGDIVAAGGADLANALFAECCAIATTQGFVPSENTLKFSRGTFNAPGSTMMASMLATSSARTDRSRPRDRRPDQPRRRAAAARRALRIAYTHLKA